MSFHLASGILLTLIVAGNAQQELCSSPMITKGTNIILIQNVSETSPPGTVLSRLEFVGDSSQIGLRLETPSEYIRLNSASRDLIVINRFNVTDGSPMSMSLNISCIVSSNGFSRLVQVVIQVYDMNDNPPMFTNLPYSVNVSERTAINSSVFAGVAASDADPCDRGYLVYSVTNNGNPFSSYFSFPVSSVGNLVLMKQLDYETVKTINLTIIVMDNGNNITILGQLQPQHIATTTVMINIVPADDYNPLFYQSSYIGAITEKSTEGSTVTFDQPIAAKIKYSKDGEILTYSLVNDSQNIDGTYFVIDNKTGVIMTSPSSDFRFTSNLLAFQVQATKVNQSYRYATALVKVHVNRTIRPLTFTQQLYSASIDDSTPNQTLVITVTTVDGGERPIYYFSGAVADFVIDSRTGEIRVARKLNFKTMSQYNLLVSATDSISTESCNVIVNVSKLNKFNPRFSQNNYGFNISKTSSFVGQTQAEDEDPGTALTYRLIDASGSFFVDSNGRISCTCSSANFSSLSYSLLVVVEDDGQPARQGSALVVVRWIADQEPPVEGPLCTAGGEGTATRAYYIAFIVLAVVAALFLVVIVVLAICLCTRSTSNASAAPRITIEVDRTFQKSPNPSSQGSRKVGGGFEVTREYGPYLSYEGPDGGDEVGTPASSVLNSNDKLQKLRIYHSVPTQRSEPPNRNGSQPYVEDHPRANPQVSNTGSKPPLPTYPIYSSASIGTSSSPSSRVERYQFEDDLAPGSKASRRAPRSASPSPELSTHPPAPMAMSQSVPGPRRAGRLQATVAALRDSNSGDTSSTETLVTPASFRPKPSHLSFVDNTGGYQSSQEAMDVSTSALTQPPGESGITVYY